MFKRRGSVEEVKPGRNLKEFRDAVGVFVHADTYAKPHVGISLAPVPGKAGGDKMRTFGKKLKYEVWALANNIPGFRSPSVRIRDEKVTPRTYKDKRAFKSSEWQVKGLRPGAGHSIGSLPPFMFKVVHIAVAALFGNFLASLPGVPGVVRPGYVGVCAHSDSWLTVEIGKILGVKIVDRKAILRDRGNINQNVRIRKSVDDFGIGFIPAAFVEDVDLDFGIGSNWVVGDGFNSLLVAGELGGGVGKVFDAG